MTHVAQQVPSWDDAELLDYQWLSEYTLPTCGFCPSFVVFVVRHKVISCTDKATGHVSKCITCGRRPLGNIVIWKTCCIWRSTPRFQVSSTLHRHNLYLSCLPLRLKFENRISRCFMCLVLHAWRMFHEQVHWENGVVSAACTSWIRILWRLTWDWLPKKTCFQ